MNEQTKEKIIHIMYKSCLLLCQHKLTSQCERTLIRRWSHCASICTAVDSQSLLVAVIYREADSRIRMVTGTNLRLCHNSN